MTKTDLSLVADLLRQSLAAGQMPFLTISSGSMAPLLQSGDQVGLEPIEANQLMMGDIVTLVQDGHFLTHRFWGMDDERRLQTRGDRPLTPDAPSQVGQLLGRVAVRRRHNRELGLQVGAGRRLNQHLAWLVQVESYLLTGRGPLSTTPLILPGKRPTLMVKLIRRVFFVWAILVTSIFG